MKKKILSSVLIMTSFIGLFAQNSIPNGNFESWTDYSYENPRNYFSTNNWSIIDFGQLSCVKTIDSYHGNYAVKLTTLSEGDGMSYISNYNPDGPPPWHGGFPYNQTPTGIKGYFKSSFPTPDSALVLINFSKNGVGTDIYYYYLTGNNNNYIPFNFSFNPPLTQIPDSVIFFITSSDPFNTAIIGSTITVDSISFTGTTIQPTLFNGDFELWDSFTFTNLDIWNQDGGSDDFVNSTTDKVAGNYAVELITYLREEDGSTKAEAQRITTSYWDDQCDCRKGGNPFSNSIDTLAFWYKYISSANNPASVWVNFKKDGNYIDNIYYTLTHSSNYQYIEIPFLLMNTPDTVLIEFSSSIWADSLPIFVGSKLLLDEVHFKSQPLTTNIISREFFSSINIYPNPSFGKFSINSKKNIDKIEIFNIAGENVYTKFDATTLLNIDISNHPKGMYFYKVTTDKSIIYKGKIILN